MVSTIQQNKRLEKAVMNFVAPLLNGKVICGFDMVMSDSSFLLGGNRVRVDFEDISDDEVIFFTVDYLIHLYYDNGTIGVRANETKKDLLESIVESKIVVSDLHKQVKNHSSQPPAEQTIDEINAELKTCEEYLLFTQQLLNGLNH